jgi:hypothetical protein
MRGNQFKFVRDSLGNFTCYTFSAAPGYYYNFAQGINNLGVIVGTYDDPNGRAHAFVRSASGVLTSFDYPGATDTVATAINDDGVIVGFYDNYNGGPTIPPQHGFILDSSGFTSLDFPGSQGTVINDINDLGQIVGDYELNSPNGGFNYAFLATPAVAEPEPSTLLFVFTGGMMIWAARRTSR